MTQLLTSLTELGLRCKRFMDIWVFVIYWEYRWRVGEAVREAPLVPPPPPTKKKSSFLQPPFSSIKILGGVSHETAVSSFCESSTAQYWWTLQVRITCRCFFASIAKPSWIKSLDCATEKWAVTQAHSSGLITKAKVTILRGWDYKSSDLWWQCRVGKTPNISKRWAGAERSCMAQKTLCGIIMHVKTQQWYLYTRNCR